MTLGHNVITKKLAILHQLWPFFLSPCVIPKGKPPHLEHPPSKSCRPPYKNMTLAIEQTVFGTTHLKNHRHIHIHVQRENNCHTGKPSSTKLCEHMFETLPVNSELVDLTLF